MAQKPIKRFNLRYDPISAEAEHLHRQNVTTGKRAGTPAKQRETAAEKIDHIMGQVRTGSLTIKTMPGFKRHTPLTTNRRLAARKRALLAMNSEVESKN